MFQIDFKHVNRFVKTFILRSMTYQTENLRKTPLFLFVEISQIIKSIEFQTQPRRLKIFENNFPSNMHFRQT